MILLMQNNFYTIFVKYPHSYSFPSHVFDVFLCRPFDSSFNSCMRCSGSPLPLCEDGPFHRNFLQSNYLCHRSFSQPLHLNESALTSLTIAYQSLSYKGRCLWLPRPKIDLLPELVWKGDVTTQLNRDQSPDIGQACSCIRLALGDPQTLG